MADSITSCLSASIDFASRLDAARRGSRSAQEALFKHYYEQVERVVHAQLRRALGRRRVCLAARFSTADVVQDVFCSLLRNLGDFDGSSEGEFVAYVVKTIRHRTIDTIRHHRASCRDYRRSLARLGDAAPGELAVTCDASFAAEFEGTYGAALQSLPTAAGLILRARIERGLSFEALASELGYPSRYAARRAFFAAQARLIVRLKSRFDGAEEGSPLLEALRANDRSAVAGPPRPA